MDNEAFSIWKTLLQDRILKGNKKIIFGRWAIKTCGPSSEIHVDLRSEEEKAKIPGRELVNKDHPHVVETELVTMVQSKADSSLEPS